MLIPTPQQALIDLWSAYQQAVVNMNLLAAQVTAQQQYMAKNGGYTPQDVGYLTNNIYVAGYGPLGNLGDEYNALIVAQWNLVAPLGDVRDTLAYFLWRYGNCKDSGNSNLSLAGAVQKYPGGPVTTQYDKGPNWGNGNAQVNGGSGWPAGLTPTSNYFRAPQWQAGPGTFGYQLPVFWLSLIFTDATFSAFANAWNDADADSTAAANAFEGESLVDAVASGVALSVGGSAAALIGLGVKYANSSFNAATQQLAEDVANGEDNATLWYDLVAGINSLITGGWYWPWNENPPILAPNGQTTIMPQPTPESAQEYGAQVAGMAQRAAEAAAAALAAQGEAQGKAEAASMAAAAAAETAANAAQAAAAAAAAQKAAAATPPGQAIAGGSQLLAGSTKNNAASTPATLAPAPAPTLAPAAKSPAVKAAAKLTFWQEIEALLKKL